MADCYNAGRMFYLHACKFYWTDGSKVTVKINFEVNVLVRKPQKRGVINN